MSPISTRICVPNLVAVRWSCRKGGGGYRQTDRQTDRQTVSQTDRQRKLQLYIVDNIYKVKKGNYHCPNVGAMHGCVVVVAVCVASQVGVPG